MEELKPAKKIKVLSYEEMLEMSSLGAKVMQPASIQDAKLNKVKIDVKSSFTNKTNIHFYIEQIIMRNRHVRPKIVIFFI